MTWEISSLESVTPFWKVNVPMLSMNTHNDLREKDKLQPFPFGLKLKFSARKMLFMILEKLLFVNMCHWIN